MHRRVLTLYHHLPASVRSLAASLHGYRLRAWRYGPETERLVEEALERDAWSPEQWRAWQDERLAYVLHRAATRVPYYRRHWEEKRRRGDRAAWDDLAHWPLLDKDPLRADPRAFVADGCDTARMYCEHTSGTTGKSLVLWWSREMVRSWYALSEARWRRWYGVSRRDRWAILGGQLVAPVAQPHPPFWTWNAALNQLYMSSYHLSPAFIPHYLDALKHYRVRYLLGYTSSLHAVAQEALRQGRRDVRMQVVVANAEPVYNHQREAIEAAFGCPLRETYGMSEAVAAAGECEHGNLHLWPEVGIVEVMDQGHPVPAGVSGDLICTGLMNVDMPLIRYRVGDRGALASSDESCPCGRTLPLVEGLEGRCDDVLCTKDGRLVGRLDVVFKARLPVREAQIIQESLDRVRVRYVPALDYTDAAARAIVESLQERLGEIEVVLEAVDEIPRTRNGKFSAVLCNIPPDQRPGYSIRSHDQRDPSDNGR